MINQKEEERDLHFNTNEMRGGEKKSQPPFTGKGMTSGGILSISAAERKDPKATSGRKQRSISKQQGGRKGTDNGKKNVTFH